MGTHLNPHIRSIDIAVPRMSILSAPNVGADEATSKIQVGTCRLISSHFVTTGSSKGSNSYGDGAIVVPASGRVGEHRALLYVKGNALGKGRMAADLVENNEALLG